MWLSHERTGIHRATNMKLEGQSGSITESQHTCRTHRLESKPEFWDDY